MGDGEWLASGLFYRTNVLVSIKGSLARKFVALDAACAHSAWES